MCDSRSPYEDVRQPPAEKTPVMYSKWNWAGAQRPIFSMQAQLTTTARSAPVPSILRPEDARVKSVRIGYTYTYCLVHADDDWLLIAVAQAPLSLACLVSPIVVVRYRVHLEKPDTITPSLLKRDT